MNESGTVKESPLVGLSSAEAARLLEQLGPNAVTEEKSHPLLALLRKFWSPVPWMLEATIILQIIIGKLDEAVVIAVLLVVNAIRVTFRRAAPTRRWLCFGNVSTFRRGYCAMAAGSS